MNTTNNPVVDQFIIDICLIDPVSKIIDQLNNKELRDCDIKWLDMQLDHYMNLAATMLGLSELIMPSDIEYEPHPLLNEYNVMRYLKYFNALLNYFKSF